MRIGIDASRAFIDQPTGTERYALEVIREMLKLPEAREHEWVVYTRGAVPDDIEKKFTQLKNLTVCPISLPYLWTQVGLAARTWIDQLDVLWVPAHTLPLVRRVGLRTVVTIHGIEYEWLPAYENRLQRWYLPLSTKYAVATADRVIAVSEFTKQQLVTRLGAEEKKITVVYEGVTSTTLSDLPPNLRGRSNREILEKYGLKKGEYLLFVGTVQPRKNLVRLIEAFSRVVIPSEVEESLSNKKNKGIPPRTSFGRDDKIGLRLVIAGRLGWQYEEVIEAPKRYGVEEKVDIVGYISDAERQGLLENCLAYVQPSITEGFGLPVLEAMSAGVPVVTSNGGALGEIVAASNAVGAASNVACAEVFDPLNVANIVRALEKMINGETDYRRKLGEKGRVRAAEFTWNKAARETLKVLTTTR